MSLHFAQLAMIITNYIRPAHTPAYKLGDFLFDFLTDPTQPPRQTAAQQQALLEHVTRNVGHRGRVFPADATDDEMEAFLFGEYVPAGDDEEEC